MKTLMMACLVAVALSACDGDHHDAAASSEAVASANSSAPAVRALPFSIEEVMLSDLFQNGLKVAKVEVGVNGGTSLEWAATSVAIAEKVASFGADSIEVSVRRNEITQPHGVMFREVAHAWYSPNPKHTVWEEDKRWLIFTADPAHLATQKDVSVYFDFQEVNEKLIDKGMDTDAADKKAGAVIAKRYHLPKDWRLSLGNMFMNGDGIPRDSFSLDVKGEAESLAALNNCMNGKIIRMFKTCDGG